MNHKAQRMTTLASSHQVLIQSVLPFRRPCSSTLFLFGVSPGLQRGSPACQGCPGAGSYDGDSVLYIACFDGLQIHVMSLSGI